jgi:divalent metal cation (Fe/Co/Zn/Cd) transporter
MKSIAWMIVLIAGVLMAVSFGIGWYEVSRDVDARWGWTPLMLVAVVGFSAAIGLWLGAMRLLRNRRGQ